jgi:hypothetical protein
MSRQVDKKILDLEEKFANVLTITKKKQVDFALECKINPNTLSKALERLSFSEDIVDKIYDKYGVRKDYWYDGKEPILERNGTGPHKPGDYKQNGYDPRETFYTDLIENNTEYTIMPRVVLRDYKIVPDKVIDAIIESKDGEKKALKEAMDMATASLLKKHSDQIEEYERQFKIVEAENIELRKKNEDLLKQLASKGQ